MLGPVIENCNFSERLPPAKETPEGKAFTPASLLKSILIFSIISD